jgi:DNA-binding transcriptional LysR family regulator
VGTFKSKYPDISISLLIGGSRQVSEWVDDGRVEVGVVGAPPVSKSLQARPLMDDDIVIAVPSDHPWARRPRVSVEDLRAEPLLLRERGSGSREAVERALAAHGLTFAAFRVVGEMGSTQAIKQAVRAGLGVSLISRRAVADECRAGLLTCVGITGLDIRRSFHLVTSRERTRSPLAQAFLEFIESHSAQATS